MLRSDRYLKLVDKQVDASMSTASREHPTNTHDVRQLLVPGFMLLRLEQHSELLQT